MLRPKGDMLKYPGATVAPSRLLLLLLVIVTGVATSSCSLFNTKKRIQVPQLLGPRANATRDELFREINRVAGVKSIHGRMDIQFEDTSFATIGIADKYRLVDGNFTLQRPGKIYLTIQFSIVDIAQMASDGEHFAVAVLQGDEKYRRFVKGTNSAVYPKLETNGTTPATKDKKAEKETVSALSNLRPQHMTDAFMIRPVDQNAGNIYSLSEFFQEERDSRPNAKKDARVMRGYYILEELSAPQNGETQVLRRFWFDRVERIRIARIQTYDNKGQIITDVSYFNEKQIGSTDTMSLPTRIELTRPQDQYKISLTYQDVTSVILNQDFPATAFVLQNKWGLPEVDLDAQNNKKVANH